MAENVQCPAEGCTLVQLIIQKQGQEEERVNELKNVVEGMRNRLPLWATLAFTAAGTTIGILASHIR